MGHTITRVDEAQIFLPPRGGMNKRAFHVCILVYFLALRALFRNGLLGRIHFPETNFHLNLVSNGTTCCKQNEGEPLLHV